MSATLTLAPPPLSDFIALRAAEGWGKISEDAARASLAASQIQISAYVGQTLAGYGRVVGDGVLYFYIQDLIVAPACRTKGLGADIMNALLAEVSKRAVPGAMVGLMAAQGKEGFYERFGFITRPSDSFGASMIKVL